MISSISKSAEGTLALFVLLWARVVLALIAGRFRFSFILVYPLAVVFGFFEGILTQSLLFVSLVVISSYPLVRVVLAFAFFIVVVVYVSARLFKSKRYVAAYIFAIYALVIPSASILKLNIKTTLQPYIIKKCSHVSAKKLKKIFVYPDCLKTKHKDICRELFERGSPYDVFYHAGTDKIILTGREIRSLLVFNGKGSLIGRIDTRGIPQFITYDPVRDLIYVDSRGRGCVSAIDPYESKEIACLFKSLSMGGLGDKLLFQKGCLLEDKDILIYTMDNLPAIFAHDFTTDEDKLYPPEHFFLSFLYDVKCFGDKAVVSFALHTPLLKQGIWILDSNKGFKPILKKRLLFPAFEMASSGNLLYVARPMQGKIDLFDATNLKLVNSYRAIRGVRTLALDEENGFIYAGSFSKGRVVKINLGTGKIEQSWDIGPAVRAVRYFENAKRAFATSQCGLFELEN